MCHFFGPNGHHFDLEVSEKADLVGVDFEKGCAMEKSSKRSLSI